METTTAVTYDDLSGLDEALEVAISAAREAGSVLLEGQADARSSVKEKASVVDIVTKVDGAAEYAAVESLVNAFPDDGIVGEEGASRAGRSGRRWIIDPLDGTSNFVRGWKASAVSIGLQIGETFSVGVVYNPFVEEMFVGAIGRGAFLNGSSLQRRGGDVPFEASYVGMDGGYMTWARDQRAHVAARLLREAGEIRYGGSTALGLCHVAVGRVDAHVNVGSSLWDIAAGTVIAREAGCVVEGLRPGSEPTPQHAIATRPELLDPLRLLLTEAADLYETGRGPADM